MIQIRKAVPKDTWTIIAPARGDRPFDFSKPEDDRVSSTDCPFCEGNESKTPPEVYAIRNNDNPNSPGWKVRVFPNKYPALDNGENASVIEDDLFKTMGGFGFHEILVETPLHDTTMADLTEPEVRLILQTYVNRYKDIISNPSIDYVNIFKNHGRRAGASLYHSHSQIMGTPFVPDLVKTEFTNTRSFFERTGECYYCRLIESELVSSKRVIAENKEFIILSPYAARVPFEIHIIPKTHRSKFVDVSEDEIQLLSKILKNTLLALKNELGNFPYNYSIHTAPDEGTSWRGTKHYYHWHVEITPRITNPAGFEWGSGNSINIVKPEEAAARIRQHYR